MLELLRVETPIFRPTASGKYPKPDVQQVGGRTLLKGVIIADVGPFRNSDRGEFDESGLRTAALLMRGSGQLCYYSHPSRDGKSECSARRVPPAYARSNSRRRMSLAS